MSAPEETGQPFDIRTGAIMAHEWFTSLKDAGFSETQAVYLVGCVITGGPKTTPEE